MTTQEHTGYEARHTMFPFADGSVYGVERKVDTVILSMDESVATQLAAILAQVTDSTRMGASHYGSDIARLFNHLIDEAGVRDDFTSRYEVSTSEDGILLRDARDLS